MRLLLLVVVFAIVTDISLAQVFGKGKCPTVTVQEKFDLQKVSDILSWIWQYGGYQHGLLEYLVVFKDTYLPTIKLDHLDQASAFTLNIEQHFKSHIDLITRQRDDVGLTFYLQYLGDWYEIERFYAGFEDNTKCTVANYQLKDDGHIRVDNKGISLDDDGKVIEAIGDGYIPDKAEPAKLQIKFAEGIPYGNYWILDTDYTNYTLIYSCKGILGLTHVEFCWILSRERTLAAETKERLYQKLTDFGVKTENFLTTEQTDC